MTNAAVQVASPGPPRTVSLSLQALTTLGAAAGVQGFLSGAFDPLVDQLHDAWPMVEGRVLPAVALGALVAVPQGFGFVVGVRRHRRAADVALATGAALTAWVTFQLPLIGWTSPVQWAFVGVGVAETVAGGLWRRRSAE